MDANDRMNSRTNDQRRQIAASTLRRYARATRSLDNDRETRLTDLLADLMHLVGEGEFDDALELARGHYAFEVEEEEEIERQRVREEP